MDVAVHAGIDDTTTLSDLHAADQRRYTAHTSAKSTDRLTKRAELSTTATASAPTLYTPRSAQSVQFGQMPTVAVHRVSLGCLQPQHRRLSRTLHGGTFPSCAFDQH